MGKAFLLYDGDCGFCSSCARWAQKRVKPKTKVEPWQWTDLDSLGVNKKQATYEVVWIDENGEIFGGAQAIAQILIIAGGIWLIPGEILRVPPFRWIGHGLYRLVVINRHRLPGGTPTCAIKPRV